MDATLAQLLNHIFELELERAEIVKAIQNPSPNMPAGIDAPLVEASEEE